MARSIAQGAPAARAAAARAPARSAARARPAGPRAEAHARGDADDPGSSRRTLVLGATALAAAAALPLAPPPAAAADLPRAFFEVSFQLPGTAMGSPLGRFVIELFNDGAAPIATQRFLDLAQGKEGVHFRRSQFVSLQPTFVQVAPLKSLSYAANARVPIAGGATAEAVEDEARTSTRSHDAAGLVSLAVFSAKPPGTKDRLVAEKGKFITVTEVLGEFPNATAWTITTAPTPGLDSLNLVLGRVVEGMDVVEKIAGLPRVADNTGSPYFMAGKALGDKRALVAEKAFGKPYR